MTRIDAIAIVLLCAMLSGGMASLDGSGAPYEAAAMRFEGRITLVRVHLCGLEPGRCEGFMVLATATGGEVALAIMPGIRIEHNTQLATIEDLQVGDYVEVQAVQVTGEPLRRILKLEITPEGCPFGAMGCAHGAE
jgi:hypothetical protein